MAINAFHVSYNDFELGQIINPDEFDVNFADIMIRLNQIIDVLNQITDGIGGDGADIIDIGDILPFPAEKLQPFLEQLVEQLQSSEMGSGAEFIGSLPIVGLQGNTVHDHLASLKSLLDDLDARLVSEAERLDIRINTVEDEAEALAVRVGTAEIDIQDSNNAINAKADKSNTYTKAESNLNDDQVEATIRNEFYTKTQSNARYTNNTGNHAGTWQGVSISNLLSSIGLSGVAVQNTAPSSPTEKMLWFNPSLNEYTMYLNGQWRINSAPTQIVKRHQRIMLQGDVSSFSITIPNFDSQYDAVEVYQNSTYIAEGLEYSISGNTVTKLGGGTWTAGTEFDVSVFVAQPVR